MINKLGFLEIMGISFMLGIFSVEATDPKGQIPEKIKQIETQEQTIEHLDMNSGMSPAQLEEGFQKINLQITPPAPPQNAQEVENEVLQTLKNEFQQQGMSLRQ